MPKKKRRKPTTCCLIPFCGGVDTEDCIDTFDSFEDTAVPRGRKVLENNDETQHQMHPSPQGQTSRESAGLTSDVCISSQDSGSSNTGHGVDSKKPKEPNDNTVQDGSIGRKSSDKKYHVHVDTETNSTSTMGSPNQKCVPIKALYDDEEKKKLSDDDDDEVNGARLPKLEPTGTVAHQPSSTSTSTGPTSSQTENADNAHTITSYPAPPTSPKKMSNIRRASRPRLIKEYTSSTADIKDVTESCAENARKHYHAVRQPVPPSSPPKKAAISRASKPRLPKEQFDRINKAVSESPHIQESDDIIPEKIKGATSTDLVTVFLDSTDSSSQASSSSTSSKSELFKDLNKHADSPDLQTRATYYPKLVHETEHYRATFDNTSVLVTDISRIQKTEHSFDFAKALSAPDTNLPHPLGAPKVVLGPIKTPKGTPEQIQKNRSFTSHMTGATSATKSGLTVSRHLNFDQSIPLKNRSSDRCCDVASCRVPDPWVPSELEYSESSSDDEHSGRPSGTATVRLPAPLPPPDLLAPSLFKRRAGQSLPPVLGATSASHYPCQVTSLPSHQNRAFPRENRFNNRGRTKKF